MYRLILLAGLLLISTSLYSQSNSYSNFTDAVEVAQAYEKFFSEVQSIQGDYSIQTDLSDFKTKAQIGLNSMHPGSNIKNLKCEKVIDFTQSSSESLRRLLTAIYKADDKRSGPEWIDKVISEFKIMKVQFGIMQWEIFTDGISKPVKSIAVFDDKWNVLYDTKLANFIVHSESRDASETDNNSYNEANQIINQSSQTKSRLLTVSNFFGSVQFHYEVRVTAIVSPYITAATNDAEYNYFTNHVTCERINETGIPPSGQYPFVIFGTDGVPAVLFDNAVPYESPISITGGTGDRFNSGLYNVTGANGRNWSFTFDFSVSYGVGGIGITPVSNISPLSLGAVSNSSVNLLNYVYYYNIITSDLRAIFYDGGSLNADNFKILTGSGSGETGKVHITSKLQVGYYYLEDLNWVPSIFAPSSTAFDFSVQFLRGDHVLQPDYEMTSTNYNIAVGQIDTLRTRIKNNSHAVKIKGGSVSLNVASLNNHLTILSPATVAIDSIDTVSSKTINFIVRGNSSGTVTPQASISAMGWGWPVPPDVVINNIVSIDSNINVSPVGIVNVSLEIPENFRMYQNYPNPFNPVTKIKFDIPGKANPGNVTLRIYDNTGREVITLVNKQLNPGKYEADWNAVNYSSGVYYYKLIAGDFVEVKKMLLLK